MTYNLHPIFVHFPIALLFAFSVIKIIPFERWFPKVYWRHIEVWLLTFGVLGAFAALATGETAERLTHPNRAIVNMHANFATLSTWIYALLLIGEILFFITPEILPKLNMPQVTRFFVLVQNVLTHGIFSKILAFIAFIAIFVAGLLGGVMVYGTSADPFAKIVLRILGLNL